MELNADDYVRAVMNFYHCNRKTAECVICSARINGEERELRKMVDEEKYACAKA